jgi:hypothetical protein
VSSQRLDATLAFARWHLAIVLFQDVFARATRSSRVNAGHSARVIFTLGA